MQDDRTAGALDSGTGLQHGVGRGRKMLRTPKEKLRDMVQMNRGEIV